MAEDDIINYLYKQFVCCTPINKIKWPVLSNKYNYDLQKQILDLTVCNELILRYPIKQSYVKRFLKAFINKLEQDNIEINCDIYNTYCSMISSQNDNESMTYRHYVMNVDKQSIISIKESESIISHGSTGLCTWEAAFHLAEWCNAHKQEFAQKNVLELGSGIGLTGLTVLNFCTPKVYNFSDCHPIVLKTLTENVRLNLSNKQKKSFWKEATLLDGTTQFISSNSEVNIINLKWEDIDNLSKDTNFDIVIAADILYDSTSFESLVCGLKSLLYNTVKYIIVATTIRNEITLQHFFNLLDKYNLNYEEEATIMLSLFVQTEEVLTKILKIYIQNK